MLLFGCGGSSVLITPNYGNKILSERGLRRDSIKVIKAVDGRHTAPNAVGIAQVGLFNKKVPYLLNTNVNDFVARALDSLLVASPASTTFLPVTVSVDSFEVGEQTSLFSEEGYFRSKMRFAFPITSDSICHASISSFETTSGMDVTNSLEELMYTGIVKTARRFVTEVLDNRSAVLFVQSDQPEIAKEIDSLVSTHIASAPQSAESQNEAATLPTPFSGGAFSYYHGDKIRTGVRATYQTFKQGGTPKFMSGFGYSITYYNVENMTDLLRGNFIIFGGRYALRYSLSEGKTTPYLSAGGSLNFGTERIKYITKEETSFFFGPELVEGLGLSFNNKASIEVGAYQIALIGSKLLPSDIGFMLGLNIGF
jgi:hypothetical protein